MKSSKKTKFLNPENFKPTKKQLLKIVKIQFQTQQPHLLQLSIPQILDMFFDEFGITAYVEPFRYETPKGKSVLIQEHGWMFWVFDGNKYVNDNVNIPNRQKAYRDCLDSVINYVIKKQKA